ncbi:MAG: hypothetical protein CPSOU_3641 [uncultured Paraburkholderia sp.]|nr:MAG: hypothetical protein CPSOU_3641 [uncultured Paraburkholderia sp.]
MVFPHLTKIKYFLPFCLHVRVFSVEAEKAMAQSPFFSAWCLASGGTRCYGTVPFNQTLIQRRRRSFTVPCRLRWPHP